jgi:hypothetical protein
MSKAAPPPVRSTRRESQHTFYSRTRHTPTATSTTAAAAVKHVSRATTAHLLTLAGALNNLHNHRLGATASRCVCARTQLSHLIDSALPVSVHVRVTPLLSVSGAICTRHPAVD